MLLPKTGAAFGLAALTLASSLSTGAAATAAPDKHSASSPKAAAAAAGIMRTLTDRQYGVAWFEAPGADLNVGPNWYAKGLSLNAQPLGTEINFQRSQDPRDAGAVISYAPGPGETGAIYVTEDISGKHSEFCLTDRGGGGAGAYDQIVALDCTSGPAQNQRWRITTDGEMVNVSTARYVQYFNNVYTGKPFLGPKYDSTSTVLIGGKYRWNAGMQLSASVDSVDVFDRTAHLEGRAQPNTSVKISGGATDKTVPVNGDGKWETTVEGLVLNENVYGLTALDANGRPVATSSVTVDVKPTNLSATVVETNAGAGTARLKVSGTPGLSLTYQNKSVVLDRDGNATITVNGLSVGTTDKVLLQQFDGAKQIGPDLDYPVTVAFKPLVVKAAFNPLGDGLDAILSGTAETRAKITIVDGRGHVTTVDANDKGVWSTEVEAAGAGIQQFDVSQSINNAPADSTKVDLDYGKAVEITSPGNNTGVPSGDLTFRGDGQYNAEVEITEKGDATVLATTKGINNGSWTTQLAGVDGDLKHTYTATMHSKGNLTTTDTIVVNPGKPEEKVAPLVVQGPTENTTIVNPNGRVDFHGTGQKDAPIQIETATGIVLGNGKVGADGQWSVSTWRTVPADYTVVVTQGTGATAESKTVHYTLKLTDSVSKPFALLSPRENATIANPTGAVTFDGEGAAGARITITRGNNVPLGTGEVDSDGTFSIPTWAPITARYTVTLTENGAKPIVVHYTLSKD